MFVKSVAVASLPRTFYRRRASFLTYLPTTGPDGRVLDLSVVTNGAVAAATWNLVYSIAPVEKGLWCK
jgi:hypothetical protein